MKNSLVYLLATAVGTAVVWWCFYAFSSLSLPLLIPFAIVGGVGSIFVLLIALTTVVGIFFDTGRTPKEPVGFYTAMGVVLPVTAGISFSAAVFGNGLVHQIVLWYFGISAGLLILVWCAGLALSVLQDIEKRRSDLWFEDLMKKREETKVT